MQLGRQLAAGRATLRCLARSLGLPDDDEFARSVILEDQCTLRAVHYPGGVPPLSNRCGAHTDFGLCTLLLNEHGGPPGLQAADNTTGEWWNVLPPDGAEQGGHGDGHGGEHGHGPPIMEHCIFNSSEIMFRPWLCRNAGNS